MRLLCLDGTVVRRPSSVVRRPSSCLRYSAQKWGSHSPQTSKKMVCIHPAATASIARLHRTRAGTRHNDAATLAGRIALAYHRSSLLSDWCTQHTYKDEHLQTLREQPRWSMMVIPGARLAKSPSAPAALGRRRGAATAAAAAPWTTPRRLAERDMVGAYAAAEPARASTAQVLATADIVMDF